MVAHMSEERDEDWVEHLREQLEMLDASCAGWDAGRDSAAKQIAVSIRTLVHKGTGTPLLELLGVDQSMVVPSFVIMGPPDGSELERDLAQFEEMPPEVEIMPGVAAIGTFDDGSAPVYWPVASSPNDLTNSSSLPLPEWWDEVVMRDEDGKEVTRRNLTLWVANKDGGAHLGQRLPPTYRGLSRKGTLGFKDSFGAPYTANPIPAAMRHLGEELRNGIRAHFGRALGPMARSPRVQVARREPGTRLTGIQVWGAPVTVRVSGGPVTVRVSGA